MTGYIETVIYTRRVEQQEGLKMATLVIKIAINN